ncbi:hypothetical protein EDC96DRAFT_542650 [Choanephora cucurbitarum]|nr:hypothetical protein EDC96DRAFT_542650 [Choanephora cucurbitarum]
MGKKGNTVLIKPTKDHMIEAMARITGEAEAEAKHSMLHDICFGIGDQHHRYNLRWIVVGIYENKVGYFKQVRLMACMFYQLTNAISVARKLQRKDDPSSSSNSKRSRKRHSK